MHHAVRMQRTTELGAGQVAAGGDSADASGLFLTENRRLITRPSSLLQALSPLEQQKVRSRGHGKIFKAGTKIFSQGTPHDGIFLIESGRVRVFYTAPSGREITLAYWSPGNFVGGPEVFDTGIHSWSGIAAADSLIFALRGKALRELVTEIPALAVGIIEGLAFKGECYSALAQMLGTRSVTERLIHLLLRLTEIYGVSDKNSTFIASDFTHADLANIVGATRQWVTATLRRLQDQKILAVSKGRIVVLNKVALSALQQD